MATKQQIRKQYLQKRASLSVDEYVQLNQRLLHRFATVDLEGIKCIHIYRPIIARKEPDTLLLIQWLKHEHPDIKLVYPKTDFENLSMTSFLDDEELDVAENHWGITEPTSGNTVDAGQIDMVIGPLLAFDVNGYRVGYGKGFYDRFMAQCAPQTLFVGLSFFEPVPAISDIDGYDIALHMCITPDKTYRF